MSDIYDDILWKLRIPLPYNLAGMTTTELGDERRKAADEIERLRKELQHSALQTNVMRNIAITPYDCDGEKIADLAAELAEFQHQYLMLKKDRDRWAKWGEHVFTCPNKGINPCRDCVSPATADAMSRVDKGGAW
jgi:hypothetical protein